MKLVSTPQRQNVTIEFTPDEQDDLFTLVGNITGGTRIRVHTDKLYDILKEGGAKSLGHDSYKDIVVV